MTNASKQLSKAVREKNQDAAWEALGNMALKCGQDAAKLHALAKSLGDNIKPANGGTGLSVLLFDSALAVVLGTERVYFQQVTVDESGALGWWAEC